MEENYSDYYTPTSSATPAAAPAPKSFEDRVCEALENIAGEMFHIRRHLESLTDGGNSWGDAPAAIRTTGR